MAEIPDRLPLALLLAALIGAADAVTLLALGDLFAGQGGANSILLAAGAPHGWYGISVALGLVLAFVGGAAAATVFGHDAGPQRTGRVVALAAALVLTAALVVKPYQPWPFLLVAIAAGALHCARPDGPGLAVTPLLLDLGRGLGERLLGVAGWRALRDPALLWGAFLGGALLAVGLYWRIGLATLYALGLALTLVAAALLWPYLRAATAKQERDSEEDASER